MGEQLVAAAGCGGGAPRWLLAVALMVLALVVALGAVAVGLVSLARARGPRE